MSNFELSMYFLKFALLATVSWTISETVISFLKHLGHPQTKKTKWYLTAVIFSIIFQIGLLLHGFRYDLFKL